MRGGGSGQANALAVLQGDGARALAVLLAGRHGRPQAGRLEIMLLEPIRAGVMPLVEKPPERVGNDLGLLGGVVRQRGLRRGHLQHRAPLRVAVELHRQLGLLQPTQHVVERLPVLLGELELQGRLGLGPGGLRQHEAEGVEVRVAGPVQAGPDLAVLGDLPVELADDVGDDSAHRPSLLWHFALHCDVQATIQGIVQLRITAADAEPAEEDPRATFGFHAPVVHAAAANDAAEHVGAVHAPREEIVQENFFGPQILVLRHDRGTLLGQLRRDIGLRRWARRGRRRDLLNGSLLGRLHVQDGRRQLVHVPREKGIVLREVFDNFLDLPIVLGEVDILKTFELDHQVLERRQDIALLLGRLRFLPVADAPAHALDAFQQGVLMPVLAETAPHRALGPRVVAMAIPAHLLLEGAVLVLVVRRVAIQAQQALQVRISHLLSWKPQRSVPLAGLDVRHELLRLGVVGLVRGARRRGAVAPARASAELGQAHAHGRAHAGASQLGHA
mmetsp:Transcript_95162/g.291061  ORF Transcript_95162/g.291061 Transcript_95162/m.291061 type:complete len:502 (+) Transcript_95162:418-1923(+)